MVAGGIYGHIPSAWWEAVDYTVVVYCGRACISYVLPPLSFRHAAHQQ